LAQDFYVSWMPNKQRQSYDNAVLCIMWLKPERINPIISCFIKIHIGLTDLDFNEARDNGLAVASYGLYTSPLHLVVLATDR